MSLVTFDPDNRLVGDSLEAEWNSKRLSARRSKNASVSASKTDRS
jgi:hypothetical protein